ncbi:hypothetical protein R3P38DRAFT_2786774 [Favolaschia claudopus]|uniref:Uncharacterized protein n=1 Tax=Favolaschia claudopus TaxID=2862362 RepID=A0AAW0AQH3_9AGAR
MTDKVKYGKKSLATWLVKSTWRKTLQGERTLARDWAKRVGVLAIKCSFPHFSVSNWLLNRLTLAICSQFKFNAPKMQRVNMNRVHVASVETVLVMEPVRRQILEVNRRNARATGYAEAPHTVLQARTRWARFLERITITFWPGSKSEASTLGARE